MRLDMYTNFTCGDLDDGLVGWSLAPTEQSLHIKSENFMRQS